MAFIKWLRRKILRNRKTFYWFDLFSYRCYAIDRNVTSDSGEVVPPMDCIMVPEGAKIKVYHSNSRGTRHGCVSGRAVKWDNAWGLFCNEDFDTDNYQLIGTFVAKKPVKKKKTHNASTLRNEF